MKQLLCIASLMGLFLGGCSVESCAPTAGSAPDLILLKGETAEIELPPGPCPTVQDDLNLSTEVLERRAITTTRPSFFGAAVGEHLDALVPCQTGEKGVWLDVTASRSAIPGRYLVAGKTVLILSKELSVRPPLPFYAALNFDDVKRLWGADGDYLTKFGRQMHDWVRFVRAHRIEPTHQWPQAHAPADMNTFREFGLTYKSLVLDDAIAPPMVVRAGPAPSPEQLRAIQGYIQSHFFEPDVWAYTWDEGQPAALTSLLARAKLIRDHAPSLKQWATWEPLPEVFPILDGFMPVMDWYGLNVKPPYQKPWGLYTSCMAQGSCHEGGAKPTGTPLSVVEAPTIHLRMFPVVAYALGAQRILYYSLTKYIDRVWTPGGMFNEGGNGDGTVLYHLDKQPIASVRLKFWRKGMNDLEYLRLLQEDGKLLVTDARVWNKEHAPLDALRTRLAEQLGEL